MLSCEICSVEVPNEKIYNKHMEIHTAKETSSFCKDCAKTFKSKIDLVKHTSNFHKSVVPLQCKFCQKYISNQSNLTKQI